VALPVVLVLGLLVISALIFYFVTRPSMREAAEALPPSDTAASEPPKAPDTPPVAPPRPPVEEKSTPPPTPRVAASGDPTRALEGAAQALLANDFDRFFAVVGEDRFDEAGRKALRELFDAGGFALDAGNAVTELGRTPTLQRWALNLRHRTDRDRTARIEIDFAPTQNGVWRPSLIRLPDDHQGELDKPQAGDEALMVARSFVEAVMQQDFAAARQYVDHQRVNDATIAGLCIIFEEGAFELKKERPLFATVANEQVTWFLVEVVSQKLQTESRFGLVLHRDEGQPWKITEINSERILAVYASRFGDGDVYFTPLVRNPRGGDSVVLFFGFDDSQVHPRTLRQIEIVAGMLKADPARGIKISGHADARGTDDYNMRLSEIRARTVRDALIEFGVAADQIELEAHGATLPRRANFNPDGTDNPQGRRVNRRAEIYLDF